MSRVQDLIKKLRDLEFAEASKYVDGWNFEMIREFKRSKFHRILVHYLEEIFYHNLETKPILKCRICGPQILFEYIYLWSGQEISVTRAHSLEHGLDSPARYYMNSIEFLDEHRVFEGNNFDRITDIEEEFIPGVMAFYLLGI